MKYKMLDCVRIKVDSTVSVDGHFVMKPIKKGMMGTIMEVYKNGYEVEFVNKSGRTDALLTLTENEIELIK